MNSKIHRFETIHNVIEVDVRHNLVLYPLFSVQPAQDSHRNWAIKFNEFSMINLNFHDYEMLKTMVFRGILLLRDKENVPVFKHYETFGLKDENP